MYAFYFSWTTHCSLDWKPSAPVPRLLCNLLMTRPDNWFGCLGREREGRECVWEWKRERRPAMKPVPTIKASWILRCWFSKLNATPVIINGIDCASSKIDTGSWIKAQVLSESRLICISWSYEEIKDDETNNIVRNVLLIACNFLPVHLQGMLSELLYALHHTSTLLISDWCHLEPLFTKVSFISGNRPALHGAVEVVPLNGEPEAQRRCIAAKA